MLNAEQIKAKYGASEHGKFRAIDSIGVPHPYCIMPKHVEVAADHFSGRLGEEAIRAAEKQGAKCGICKGQLKYDQHEHAVLIECDEELQVEGQTNPELQAFLLKLKDQVEPDGFVGFAFKRGAQ